MKVGKGIIFDKKIDALALGLYVKLLAFGNDWDLNIPQLAKILGLGYHKTQKYLAVLEEAGYMKRSVIRNENGRVQGWKYEVFANKSENRLYKKPTDGKNRQTENCTDIIEINSSNRDYKYKKEKYKKEFRTALPDPVERERQRIAAARLAQQQDR